jgi:hypothetical protein
MTGLELLAAATSTTGGSGKVFGVDAGDLRSALAVIGGVVTFVVFFSLIRGGIGSIRRLWRKTLGQRGVLYNALDRLAVEAQLAWFSEQLRMQPAVRRAAGEYFENLYIHRFAYVQAFTDAHDRVVSYAVTTRSKEFRPTVWGTTAATASVGKKSLGKSAFGEIGMIGLVNGVNVSRGARRFWYAESYWFGNPGNYQDYILAYNDAGFTPKDSLHEIEGLFPGSPVGGLSYGQAFGGTATDDEFNAYMQSEGVRTFRRTAKPNTYGVTAPFGGVPTPMGPDKDTVRVIPA